MKISVKTVPENLNEHLNIQKFGYCINILIDDTIKYVVRYDKVISIEDTNGNQVYSAEAEYPNFKESFKHGVVYTYNSNDKKIVITRKNHFKNIIEYNNNVIIAEKYPKGKYTYYPIFINNVEIAEGVLLNRSKYFSLDFDIYLLKEYESNYEALCMLCIFLYQLEFIKLLSPDRVNYEWAISIFPKKDSYNPDWLKSNFNINL